MPRHVIWSALISLAVALVIVVMPAPSAAQSGLSPADNAVLKAYVLDAGKVNRFIAGLSALAMASNRTMRLPTNTSGWTTRTGRA